LIHQVEETHYGVFDLRKTDRQMAVDEYGLISRKWQQQGYPQRNC